jgi:hypothetical protein
MNTDKNISICVVIVSSFEPLYLFCNNIIRKQSLQYKIPVFFLLNGKLPENYILKKDERFLEHTDGLCNPWMFLKFKTMLQEIYNNSSPDYILRCNSTTFINFTRLPELFASLPTENLIAGPFMYSTGFIGTNVFCQGSNMILSKDVAKRLAYDQNEKDPFIFEYADDIAIDFLTRTYAKKNDLSLYTMRYEEFTTIPKFYELPINPANIFFRVKNNTINRFEIDSEIWKLLHYLFDVIHYRNTFTAWAKYTINTPRYTIYSFGDDHKKI